jgi:broad specificity phosphatase PhoE
VYLTTIDLLRHGEAQGGNYFRGITDDPLTETGWQQMYQAVANQTATDCVISSPLTRCQAFADALSEQQQSKLQINPGFQELDFGAWEGKTADEISLSEPGALMRFYTDPKANPPPGGEQLTDFRDRISSCWNKTILENSDKHLLIVTHAGVIRMLFSQILEIPLRNTFKIQIAHASLTRFQCIHSEKEKQYQLIFHHNPKNLS